MRYREYFLSYQEENPLLNKKYFETDSFKRDLLKKASQLFLSDFESFIQKSQAKEFSITNSTIFIEDIASGDQFISNKQQIQNIKNNLPNVVCVEMEGAAVAQVCYEYQIPFSIIRTISDKANDNSHIDFTNFAKQIASNYALGILKNYFKLI